MALTYHDFCFDNLSLQKLFKVETSEMNFDETSTKFILEILNNFIL